jgi:DNA polymerase/3'-5' exonuclease PolX
VSNSIQKMPLCEALDIAREFQKKIQPACQRIEIAGSLRRAKPFVGDIELVILPWFEAERDLFGNLVRQLSHLDYTLEILKPNYIKCGDRFKQIDLGPIVCDLWIQLRPETWGVNFTLRTGSADFSHWLVTKRKAGGGCPSHLQIEDGLLKTESGQVIPTLEEGDFFEALGVRWLPPTEREEGRWK